MDVNVYLAVQRLNVGDTNWNTLITAMQQKGANQNAQANNRNHWRPSLDETIWIFEARFESTVVDTNWFISWLAGEFSVLPSLILPTEGFNIYGRFVTLNYLALNRIRLGVLGFVQGQGWPSWDESRAAATQYILDNDEDWNTETNVTS